jgi:hypothetical protein
MGGLAALPNDGEPMTVVQAKFAVFYGEPDQKRGCGWYWTVVPGPGEPTKGPYTGPFETKAAAVEDANQAPVTSMVGGGEIDRRSG